MRDSNTASIAQLAFVFGAGGLWRGGGGGGGGILCYLLITITTLLNQYFEEDSGSVVECLTRDQWVAGSSLTGGTAFCP